MANNSRTILIISILAMIVSLLGGIVANVASSALPESWTPYLWLAWPLFAVFLILSIALLIWQVRASEVPPPPQPKPAYSHEGWFLKHYYLAQADFTGRKSELEFLTNWLEQKNDKPLLVLLALGGFGKSSLVWHWINNAAPPKGLSKVVWWGFYDDNSFDTFLSETLEYLDIDPKALSIHEQIEMLARYVRDKKILIVMDGFERALRAYGSMNAAYQGDEANNEVTNNQCVSIHAGSFLRRVASLNAQGRVLLTTRLLPDDLKDKQSGNVLTGCEVHDLDKLSKEDAVAFFKAQKINGTRVEIEMACEVYGYHPLSLRLLAGRIVRDRSRDIKLARNFKIDADLKGRQNHILKVAYESLSRPRRLLLSKMAAFRSPMDFDAIKIFEIKLTWLERLFFGSQDMLTVLNDFITRGLVHHDPNKDQYDLHPIVRRYAYDRLTTADRASAHERLVNYFEAVPKPEKIEKLEDLAPVIELYHHMVGAGDLDDAVKLLRDRLVPHPLHYQFGAYQLIIELGRALFLDGDDKPPCLKREDAQAWILNSIAASYGNSGQPRRAAPLFEMQIAIREKMGSKKNAAIGLGNLAEQQLNSGTLSAAERNLRRCNDLCREIASEFDEAVSHQELGHVLSCRGAWQEAEQKLSKAEKVFDKYGASQTNLVSVVRAYRALYFLLMAREQTIRNQLPVDNVKSAIESAQHALELAEEHSKKRATYPRDYVRAHWLLGAAYRANWVSTGSTSELTMAEENLSKALNLCRQINAVADEANILLDVARLRYAQGDFKDAQEKAEEALVITERSGYMLQGADVHLFLAQYALEQEKDKVKAKEYAEKAKELAYCDGGEYKYKVAYNEAVAMLERLNV